MNQKGKVFSLIALSGAMLFSFAIIGKNFDFLGVRAAGGISEPINSSVVFTRNDTFKTIGTYKYSVKSRTPNNTDVYAIIDCKTTFSSSYIASFPSKSDTDYETKIYFSEDENGQKPFLFQKVTAIKFTFNSGSANICIGSFSGTDYEYDNFESFESGVSKEINHTANKEVRVKGPTKDNRQLITRPVKSIELFFTCDYNYIPPVEHSISSAPTTNGSITLEKTSYFRDDEVKFTVTPNDGYYASSVTTSDPDTVPIDHTTYYSFIMPDEDVEIRVTFEPIPVVLYNVYIGDSEHGTVNLSESQTQYTAGSTVSFTIDSIDDGYRVVKATLGDEQEISQVDGVYSFTMPAEDVTINVEYELIPIPKYSVSFAPYEHGSVDCETGEYEEGDFVELTAEAADGYKIGEVYYNDHIKIEGESGYYLFEMPASDVEITVEFVLKDKPAETLEKQLENLGTFRMKCDGYSLDDIFVEYTFNSDGSGVQHAESYGVWSKHAFTYKIDLNGNVSILSANETSKSGGFGFRIGVAILVNTVDANNFFAATISNNKIVKLNMSCVKSGAQYKFEYTI